MEQKQFKANYEVYNEGCDEYFYYGEDYEEALKVFNAEVERMKKSFAKQHPLILLHCMYNINDEDESGLNDLFIILRKYEGNEVEVYVE